MEAKVRQQQQMLEDEKSVLHHPDPHAVSVLNTKMRKFL